MVEKGSIVKAVPNFSRSIPWGQNLFLSPLLVGSNTCNYYGHNNHEPKRNIVTCHSSSKT